MVTPATVTPELLAALAEGAALEGDTDRLNRMLALADELRAESRDPLDGFMAGRVYVPPSPWQGAARMANAGVSALGEHRGNQLRRELTQTRADLRQQMLPEIIRQQMLLNAARGGGAANPTVPAATSPSTLSPQAGGRVSWGQW